MMMKPFANREWFFYFREVWLMLTVVSFLFFLAAFTTGQQHNVVFLCAASLPALRESKMTHYTVCNKKLIGYFNLRKLNQH
jgi:hypothetical protein